MQITDALSEKHRKLYAVLLEQKYIFVDLDGTLVTSELMADHIIYVIMKKLWFAPIILGRLCIKFLRNKMLLKEELAREITLWEYRMWLVEMLGRVQVESNAKIILITGSNAILGAKIANDLQQKNILIFDEVIGSDLKTNYIGVRKLEKMMEYTDNIFYIGNSHQDLIIFDKTQQGCLITAKRKLINNVNKSVIVIHE